MDEPTWVRLKSLKLNPTRYERVSGTDVEVAFSPFDVPTAARSYRDPHSRFVIEFKYLSEGEPREEAREGDITVLTGKTSHRLYSLVIDASALHESNSITLLRTRLKEAIDKTAVSQPSTLRSGNYQAAKEVIESNDGAELLRKAVA